MKKIIYDTIKNILKVIITFLVTLSTAILASNNQNVIYTFLENFGYTDDTVKKAVLSGVIVALISLISLILKLLKTVVLHFISRYLRRLSISIDFKINDNNTEIIKFKPVNKIYQEKKLEIELIVMPAGIISMWILKKILGLQLEIFFNPQIIDISLMDDKEWLDEDTGTKIVSKQAIQIGVLDNYRLGGNSEKPFRMTESIIILPKRVKEDTTNINFKIKTINASSLGRALCDLTMEELTIECEGGK